MTTVMANPSKKEVLGHLISLEMQGTKVFLTADGIAWLNGSFHKKQKQVAKSQQGGQKIVFRVVG